MKDTVNVELNKIIFSVGTCGIEGDIVIDYSTDTKNPITNGIACFRNQETVDIRKIPKDIQEELKEVFKKLEKVVNSKE